MTAVTHAETRSHAEVPNPGSFEFDDHVIFSDSVSGPAEHQAQLLAQLFGTSGNELFEHHGFESQIRRDCNQPRGGLLSDSRPNYFQRRMAASAQATAIGAESSPMAFATSSTISIPLMSAENSVAVSPKPLGSLSCSSLPSP